VLATARRFRPIHVPAIEVADAVVQHLALLDETLERPVGLVQRMASPPVQEIQVDPIRSEPRQAPLRGADRTLAGSVVRKDLRDEHDLVPAARDRLADDVLGPTLAVHLCRVDQAQSEIETETQRGDLVVAAGALLAHAPRALAQPRHGEAVTRPHDPGRRRPGPVHGQRSNARTWATLSRGMRASIFSTGQPTASSMTGR